MKKKTAKSAKPTKRAAKTRGTVCESLTKRFANRNDILSAARLADVAERFDKDELVRKNFPRTVKDVVVVDSAMKPTGENILTKVMDGCIQPNEGTITPNYVNLDPRNINDKVFKFFADDNAWLGWMACATIAQHPLVSRLCSIPGEDAISVGYKLHPDDMDANGDGVVNDGDERYLAKLIKKSRRMGLDEVCRKLDYNKRVFGIGICVPCFESTSDDGKEFIWKMLESPRNLDALKRSDILYSGMKVVDPYWMTPQFDEESGFNPVSRDFYTPTWWQVGSTRRRIHKSWCIQVVNTIVSDILKPTYYYGGMPLPQMVMKRIYSADCVANEAQMLAMSKRLLVVDANVNRLVANPKEAAKVMDALKYARDNWGVFFKNPNTNVQQVDTYITEFNQLIMTQYQLVASLGQIPAPKLLKVMPTGFSDITELVWKDYAQSLNNIQENEYRPLLEAHYEYYMAIVEKKRIELEVVFNPVDVPTLMEKAQIEQLEAKTDGTLVDSGIVSPEEVRVSLRNKRGGRYAHIEKKPPDDAKRREQILSLNAYKNASKTSRSLEKKVDGE